MTIIAIIIIGVCVAWLLYSVLPVKAKGSDQAEDQNADPQKLVPVKGNWYMCVKDYRTCMAGRLYPCKYDGAIYDSAVVTDYYIGDAHLYFREATEEEVVFQTSQDAGQEDQGNNPPPAEAPDPVVDCTSETHRLYGVAITARHTEERIQVGWYDVNEECGCQWKVVDCDGFDVLSDFLFENGQILAKVALDNTGEERTTRYITLHTGKGGERRDFFDVTQEAGYDGVFEGYLSHFAGVVTVERGTITYNYLKALYDEAVSQYRYIQEWFSETDELIPAPSLYNLPSLAVLPGFGNPITVRDEKGKAFGTLIGWLFAMELAGLRPADRTEIFAIGYEMGGYNKYSNVYGYARIEDPNNMRLTAAAIYSAMRGVLHPDESAMRNEVGGTTYRQTLKDLASGKRDDVGCEDFFIDFRRFMPTAPGPYAPGYTSRPDDTYPGEEKDEYGNLQIDRKCHDGMVEFFNLDSYGALHQQRCVQAIADKEGDRHHLFGEDRQTQHYTFKPVFGADIFGQSVDPDGMVADFCCQMQAASNSARGILQTATLSPVQYGRLRPGCSWKQEGVKNSATDDRYNVLTNFEIEDGDGCPTGYYDKDGNWVIMNGVSNPQEFEEQQKNALYANSYPSGHSAGIVAVAMALSELRPDKANLIWQRAIVFSESRSVARYHWMSDIINGRVLGTAQAAVSRAASDYGHLLEQAQDEMDVLKCF